MAYTSCQWLSIGEKHVALNKVVVAFSYCGRHAGSTPADSTLHPVPGRAPDAELCRLVHIKGVKPPSTQHRGAVEYGLLTGAHNPWQIGTKQFENNGDVLAGVGSSPTSAN